MSETGIRLGLLPSLEPLLKEWLPRQRWFAGKGRPVTGVGLVSATELLPPGVMSPTAPGLLHLLVRVRQGVNGGDCYQLLLGVRRSLPPRLAGARIGRPDAGPLAGYVVYEGLLDPRLAGLVLERLRLPGRLGELRFTRAPSAEIRGGLAPRPLAAEQSNSSLVYGDTYILKLFRRVLPGAHPDLEVPLALAGQGCARVPAPVAWFERYGSGTAGEPSLLGVLQPYLAGAEDGWTLTLRALADGGDFVAEARALGRATAETHQALAAALPTLPLDRARTERIAAGMAQRLQAAARAVPALRPHVPGLAAVFAALPAAGDGNGGFQRIHGDLHLGQCLRTPDGAWALIDFEGEPARPLAERRHPQPPVRDVAGMLRSFDYAAHLCRAPALADRCRDAYCAGYAAQYGHDPRSIPELLHAYETDKAVYEVLYEARNRPDWLPVPMAAVRRLATATAP
ncbi:maltokinase N-terminal cap-like domain-containing protein [Streptomyces sp. NPDC002851]